MGKVEYLNLSKEQSDEFVEVKQKYDEFKQFKKLRNKPNSLVVTLEDILEPIKNSELARKCENNKFYQWKTL